MVVFIDVSDGNAQQTEKSSSSNPQHIHQKVPENGMKKKGERKKREKHDY